MVPAVSLARSECLDRLRSARVGRIAVTSRVLPAIVPINYTVVGNTLVFRTRPGGMLARACDNAVVAFEADEVEPDGQAGWSVLVVGVAELLEGSAAIRAVERGLVSAVGVDRDGLSRFVAITMTKVTGRLVPHADVAVVARPAAEYGQPRTGDNPRSRTKVRTDGTKVPAP